MPSIYKNLKNSDRKYIRTQKALIRRQVLDVAKQEELITQLYKKMVPSLNSDKAEKPTPKKEIKVAPKKAKAKSPKKEISKPKTKARAKK